MFFIENSNTLHIHTPYHITSHPLLFTLLLLFCSATSRELLCALTVWVKWRNCKRAIHLIRETLFWGFWGPELKGAGGVNHSRNCPRKNKWIAPYKWSLYLEISGLFSWAHFEYISRRWRYLVLITATASSSWLSRFLNISSNSSRLVFSKLSSSSRFGL